MYTRERTIGKLKIKSTSLNKPSDEALEKLAKEIILIEKRGEVENGKSSRLSA